MQMPAYIYLNLPEENHVSLGSKYLSGTDQAVMPPHHTCIYNAQDTHTGFIANHHTVSRFVLESNITQSLYASRANPSEHINTTSHVVWSWS